MPHFLAKPNLFRRMIIGAILGIIIAGSLLWAGTRLDPDARRIWRTEGYGMILDLTGPIATIYEETGPYCLKTLSFPALTPALRYGKGATITTEADLLRLDIAGSMSPILAHPINAIPVPCTTPTESGPETIFEMVWHAMNDHYAFFDLHGVNWQSRYDMHRAKITSTTTDPELFLILSEMLTGLDDGHISLKSPDSSFSPEISPTWVEDKPAIKAVLAKMELAEVDDTGLSYGWLPDQVGYIRLRNMSVNSLSPIQAANRAEKAMAQVVDALANARGIILDNRWNPGGSDDISLAFASLFADRPHMVFSKETRNDNHYSARTTVHLTPSERTNYSGPVTVLNSAFTASAAEIFTMAMQEFPQVTVMGEATSGAHSDILERALPNGWSLGLSHQRYYAADGQNYESVGLPPDLQRPFDREGFAKGVDTLLTEAQQAFATRN